MKQDKKALIVLFFSLPNTSTQQPHLFQPPLFNRDIFHTQEAEISQTIPKNQSVRHSHLNRVPSSVIMAQKKIRLNWKLEGVEKTFLETCVHEVTLNGLQGSSLKPISWKNVAEKMKIEHNFIADQKQMKNRYDYLKSKFTAWSKLKNKTGNSYNPITNTFDLPEEEWEIEMKSNKFIKALRTSPLSYPELCVQLFEGSTSNGFDSCGSSSTLPHPYEEVSNHILNDLEDIECTQKEPLTQGVSDESFSQSKITKKKRKYQTFNSKLIEVGDQIIKVAKMWIEKHNLSNDMDACMEKLETMGWGELDAKYQTTLLLFGESADMRKVWLRLQSHVCELWVKNAGAKYNLF
ncbi:hypothetical protein QVD17_39065 [Tagetes erecta]|uniref:Myb/SANT-like domain-containing protein n=1 Tax=Tagetes erecta TaxID=13708 RepID=A0AAD8NEU4_TARER|nr:hypothetical protein QVD17_39065 [Tagetes erecta]